MEERKNMDETYKYYIEQRKVDLKEYIIAWFLLFEV